MSRAKPLISACMIVKDEQDNLDRCLRSLAGSVDEVIVVDTGSTDGTPEIARSHGARLVSTTWRDDFAVARNESIGHARGSWLLWIDADEELVEETPGALRRLCEEDGETDGYLLFCRNVVTENGEIGTAIKQWRLFRNQADLRFVGRIHENLRFAGGRVVNLHYQEQAWVRHWGYIRESKRLAAKRARNSRLIALALAETPDDPFLNYYAGRERSAEQEFAPALEALGRAVELWRSEGCPSSAYVPNMLALAMNAAVELGEHVRAVDLEALVPAALVSSDILFQGGLAHWRLGDIDGAAERFNRAWQDATVREGLEVDPTSSTWRPLSALAQMRLEAGDAAAAYALAKQAQAHEPRLPNLLLALAITSSKIAAHQESIAWARQILGLEDHEHYKKQARRLMLNIGQESGDYALIAEALAGEAEGIPGIDTVLMRAEALARLGDIQAQYDELSAGCQRFPDDVRVRLAAAELLETQGFTAQALEVLGGGLDQPQPSPELYQRLAVLLAKAGRLEDAANALALLEHAREPAAAPTTHT